MRCTAFPVGPIQGQVEEKREDRGKLHAEMHGEPLDVGDRAGAAQDGPERADQAAPGDGHAVGRHGARVVAIAQGQRLPEQHVDRAGESRVRMTLVQESGAPQQMRLMPTTVTRAPSTFRFGTPSGWSTPASRYPSGAVGTRMTMPSPSR